MIYSLLLLSISLSLDSLGAGLSYGIRKTKIPFVAKVIICIFSIIYAGLALVLGGGIQRFLTPLTANIIGVIILGGMGLIILIKAIRQKEEKSEITNISIKKDRSFTIALKSLEITINIIRNPSDCDIDKSGTIEVKEAILLGFALSIDAIGVGIGAALVGLSSYILPISIGLCQYVFLCVGLFFGAKLINLGKKRERVISLLPGILLMVMAVLKLI